MDVCELRGPRTSLQLTVSHSFILEGLLTVIVAFIAFFTLYDYPETATFLTAEERAFIAYRLKYDGQDAGTDTSLRVAQSETMDWKTVRSAFADWQIWINIVVYWGYVWYACSRVCSIRCRIY